MPTVGLQRLDLAMDVRTFRDDDGNTFLFFKGIGDNPHVFVEINIKAAARLLGIPDANTKNYDPHQIWKAFCDALDEAVDFSAVRRSALERLRGNRNP